MKRYISILTLYFGFIACNGESDIDIESTQDAFFANLATLCGESFTGASTYPDEPDHALVDTELNAYLDRCDDEKIEIDLYRDGDTWHTTWILERRDNGLHLFHDHIGDKDYEEGEEPLTSYGGYADDRGTSTVQYFPADDHTAEILPEASTNVWMMDLDLDEDVFIYYLERNEEPRFRAELRLN